MDIASVPPPLPSQDVAPPPLPASTAGNKSSLGLRGRIALVFDRLIGLVALVVGLAVLSAVPVLNLLSLGYLLEACGRTAKSGRMRDGCFGLEKASRLGKVALGAWLCLWPLRAISQLADAAYLIDPHSLIAARWQRGVTIFMVLTACHILWACLRGGLLRHFFWPAPIGFFRWLRTPQKYARMRDGICDFVLSLRLWHYFMLGLRGFVGGLAWLLLPLLILIGASYLPEGPAVLLSFVGLVLLGPVVLHLPYLQVNFAVQQRFGAYFEIRKIRDWYRRRPLVCLLGLFVVLASPVPLYLLKIELTPREITWLPAAVFVLFIWPAKLILGRTAHAASRATGESGWGWRWLARFGAFTTVLAYVLAVYATQYLAWQGSWSLLEQHAFLVPSPF